VLTEICHLRCKTTDVSGYCKLISCYSTDSERPHRCLHLPSSTYYLPTYHASISASLVHARYSRTSQLAGTCPHNCPFPWWNRCPYLIMVSWTHPNPYPPNGISVGSAVLAQLVVVCDKQIDRARCICSGSRIASVHDMHAMRPNSRLH